MGECHSQTIAVMSVVTYQLELHICSSKAPGYRTYGEKNLPHQLFRLGVFEVIDFPSAASSELAEAWRRLYSAGVSTFEPSFHIPLRAALIRHKYRAKICDHTAHFDSSSSRR